MCKIRFFKFSKSYYSFKIDKIINNLCVYMYIYIKDILYKIWYTLHLLVANERDKSVVQASPESSVNVEIRISASKTSQILDNIKSDLETEENDEKRVDTSQDKDSMSYFYY